MFTLTNINNLLKQINKTIPIIEENYKKNPIPMLGDILKKYQEAKDLIEHSTIEELKKNSFRLKNKLNDRTRAYLEAASDYMNPMLEDMYKTEQILKDFLS
ncbi:hypothetical protein KY305_19750 [Bacillus sp. YC2]|nr:hypothetical protein [Bacillus sp. YC2]